MANVVTIYNKLNSSYYNFMRVVIFVIIIFYTSLALAELASTKLDDLINESDLIVQAYPIKIERIRDRSGFAVLKIRKKLFGNFKGDTVKIYWTSEVHAQKISNLNQDFLLFLSSRKDNAWNPTHYGRSFWPFFLDHYDNAKIDQSKLVIKYKYPITMARMNKKQEKRLLIQSKKTISYQNLEQYILSIKNQ